MLPLKSTTDWPFSHPVCSEALRHIPKIKMKGRPVAKRCLQVTAVIPITSKPSGPAAQRSVQDKTWAFAFHDRWKKRRLRFRRANTEPRVSLDSYQVALTVWARGPGEVVPFRYASTSAAVRFRGPQRSQQVAQTTLVSLLLTLL